MGRTIQHLNARIRQHVPLHLVPPESRRDRPRRGQPPKVRATRIGTGEVATGQQPTETRQLKRRVRHAALRESAVSTGSSTIFILLEVEVLFISHKDNTDELCRKTFQWQKAVSCCCREVLFKSILQFLTSHRIFRYDHDQYFGSRFLHY